jgi:hypothetical protein
MHIAKTSGSGSERYGAAEGGGSSQTWSVGIVTAMSSPFRRRRRQRRLHRLRPPPTLTATPGTVVDALGTAVAAPDAAPSSPGELPWARSRLPGVGSRTRRHGRPSGAQIVPELEGARSNELRESMCRGCLQSRATCRRPLHRRHLWGSLQVATRCAEERQLKHLPWRSAGMCLRGR